jgi:ribonuclease R
MIRLQDLEDFYIFDENKYELRGEMTQQTFRLGQKIKIFIADADKVTRTVDFLLADDVEYM